MAYLSRGGISHLSSVLLSCPGVSPVARDSVWPAVLTKSQEMWSAHGDQGRADTGFKPIPSAPLIREGRQGGGGKGEDLSSAQKRLGSPVPPALTFPSGKQRQHGVDRWGHHSATIAEDRKCLCRTHAALSNSAASSCV